MSFDSFGIDDEDLESLDLKQPDVEPTAGERLPDGSILEPIRIPASGDVELLHWNEGESAITPHFDCAAKRYVPREDAKHLKHLPSGASPYFSTRDLINEVREFIALALNVSTDSAAQLSYFCIASFFADVLPICPVLMLQGDSTSAVSVLRLLGCITYHGLLLADCGDHSSASELRPTRLILQAGSRVDQLLAALQFPGFAVSGGGLKQISGAVALYVGDFEWRSQYLESTLLFPVPPTLRFFSPQDELCYASKINKLQNQLLQYRLQNLNAVASSVYDVPTLSGSSRLLARMFGQCIIDAPDCQEQVTNSLQTRDEASRVERSSGLNAVVMRPCSSYATRRSLLSTSVKWPNSWSLYFPAIRRG